MKGTGRSRLTMYRTWLAWFVALFLLLPGRAALSQSEHDLPLVLSASTAGREGFVRSSTARRRPER